MVLGFNKQFVDKILNGDKKFTIRVDYKNRWYVGRCIHFATGVRTKHYKEFKKGVCTGTQSIRINPYERSICVGFNKRMLGLEYEEYDINENWIKLEKVQIESLAKCDGFDSVDDFFNWFNEPFEGKIIHFSGWIIPHNN